MRRNSETHDATIGTLADKLYKQAWHALGDWPWADERQALAKTLEKAAPYAHDAQLKPLYHAATLALEWGELYAKAHAQMVKKCKWKKLPASTHGPAIDAAKLVEKGADPVKLAMAKGFMKKMMTPTTTSKWEATIGNLTVRWRNPSDYEPSYTIFRDGKPTSTFQHEGKTYITTHKGPRKVASETLIKLAVRENFADLVETGRGIEQMLRAAKVTMPKGKKAKTPTVSTGWFHAGPEPGHGENDRVRVKVIGGESNAFAVGADSKGRMRYEIVPPEGETAHSVAKMIKKGAQAGEKVFGGDLYVIRINVPGKGEYTYYKP